MNLTTKSIVVTCADRQDVTWQRWSACLYDDQLAVFRFLLPDTGVIAPYLYSLLQPDERMRAERYRREEDRFRFVYGRGIVKILAGKYTRQNPDEIRFVLGVNNKPQLAGVSTVHVSVSHAGSWILVAIGTNSVGVDIENVNPDFPFLDLMPTSFSPEERHGIEVSADPRKQFYTLWTRKEALVKATAKGIDDDFCRIPSLDGKHTVSGSLIGDNGNWMVDRINVADDYLAAVAYRPMQESPEFYTVDSGLFGE